MSGTRGTTPPQVTLSDISYRYNQFRDLLERADKALHGQILPPLLPLVRSPSRRAAATLSPKRRS